MSEPFLGEIKMFGGNFAPRGWALCDGELQNISQNQALFSLLGTTYGGDGRTTFALPDLRGRVAIHPGNGPGLSSYRLGQKGGSETETLTVAQMPAHTHTVTATGQARANASGGDEAIPTDHVWAEGGGGETIYSTSAADVDMNASAITITANAANTGGGQSHTNLQPYQCVNFIIALQGTFPSRN